MKVLALYLKWGIHLAAVNKPNIPKDLNMTLARLYALRLLAAFLLAGFTASTGCDDDDKKSTATTTTEKAATTTEDTADTTEETADDTAKDTPAAAPANDVTGNWYYKKEIMRLRQKGSSIQGTTEVIGFVNNPADPIESPVRTPGSMDADGTVRLTELVTYTANPAKSFNVVKVGKLKDSKTLVLNVISGQAAHTQTWIKK